MSRAQRRGIFLDKGLKDAVDVRANGFAVVEFMTGSLPRQVGVLKQRRLISIARQECLNYAP